MRHLVLLDAALDDLDDILRYVAHASANVEIGLNFAGQLRAQCSKLASLPGILGKARPELRPELRSFAFRNYVIIFRYVGDTLEVVNIIEGHRDIEGLFNQR